MDFWTGEAFVPNTANNRHASVASANTAALLLTVSGSAPLERIGLIPSSLGFMTVAFFITDQ